VHRLQNLIPTKALSQNVTNAPEDALTPNLKNVEVTVKTNNIIVENSQEQ